MKRLLFFLLLGAFALPLLSWKSYKGIRIEKRRYRKGYYVHVWKTGKTEPQHTAIAVQSNGANPSADRNVEETNSDPVSIAVSPPPVTQSPAPVAQQANAPTGKVEINVEPTRAIQQVNSPMPRH